MSSVRELVRIAKEFAELPTLNADDTTHRYTVQIPGIVVREKQDLYLSRKIYGMGFTIEDAAYDYMRKCRGAFLKNPITEKEIFIR